MYVWKIKEKIFEEKKCVEKCQQVRDLNWRSRGSKKNLKNTIFWHDIKILFVRESQKTI